MRSFTKVVGLGAILMAAMLFAPGIALAQNAHFLKSTGGLDAKTGDYTASWKEAGLGNSPVTYDLSATASFTWQCFTKSGNQPQGSPNSTDHIHDGDVSSLPQWHDFRQPHPGSSRGRSL